MDNKSLWETLVDMGWKKAILLIISIEIIAYVISMCILYVVMLNK